MKKIFCVFLAIICSFTLFLASCSEEADTSAESSKEESSVPVPVKKTLRVGTYNIKHCADVSDSDGKNGADTDETAVKVIADDILALDLDIVGLQEVDQNVPRSGKIDTMGLLSEYTGYKYYYYMEAVKWPNTTDVTAGSGILSKYPINMETAKTIELSRGNSWDQVRKLGCLEIDVEGTTVHFFNTHLTPLDIDMRSTEFNKINEQIKDKEIAILTGDFNVPTFDEFKALTNLTNFNNEEHKFITYPRDQKFMDNILYTSNFTVNYEKSGVYEKGHSDHSLLYAEFEYTVYE